jgi:hypothetical protein
MHRVCTDATMLEPSCTIPRLCLDVSVGTDPCAVIRADHIGNAAPSQLCQYYGGDACGREPYRYGGSWEPALPTKTPPPAAVSSTDTGS